MPKDNEKWDFNAIAGGAVTMCIEFEITDPQLISIMNLLIRHVDSHEARIKLKPFAGKLILPKENPSNEGAR